VELGGDLGIVVRSLSDVNYKPGFDWQLRADVAVIPPFLTIGAYFSMATLVPTGSFNTTTTSGSITTTVTSDDPNKNIQFITGGLRVRIRFPVGTDFMPYGVLGGGFVYGNFPNETVKVCVTIPGQNVPSCGSQPVPNATTVFGEIAIGGGLVMRLVDAVFLNAELTYRPTFGYKNDAYSNAVTSQNANIPPPSSNGNAISALAGLTIGF
jgi:opacity protein-like surface antigen